jgi:hypothetical protein
LKQPLLVALIELQRSAYCFHYGTRRDRRAGEGIEVPSIAAHAPALLRWVQQGQPAEVLQPLGIAILERVAQARSFVVTDHLHADESTVRRDRDQQLQRPAIAIGCDRTNRNGDWSTGLARAVDGDRRCGAQ